MTYLAFVGFAMMVLITYLLLKKKVSTLVAFGIIPIFGAIIAGCALSEIPGYISSGLNLTLDITLIMLFSVPYFSLMSDAGLFDTIVNFLLKHSKISAVVVCIITVAVSLITEIDGSVTSTFVITIPMLLPLYKKLKMDPKVLLFLCSASMCAMFNTPWNGRILRAASLMPEVENATNYIFMQLFPVQLILIGILMVFAVVLAKREVRRGALKELDKSESASNMIEPTELSRPKLFWFNLILTVLLIVALSMVDIPDYAAFALALVIAITVNYRDLKLQNKLLSKYAATLYPTAPAVLLSGVVVGVLQECGMMQEMVNCLVSIIPTAMGSWLYIIIALFSVPLMMIFTNDTWYYALIPIVAAICAKFGVSNEVVIMALVMNMGAMISPVAQPQIYLACDLADKTELADYISFSFVPFCILTVLWIGSGMLLGTFI